MVTTNMLTREEIIGLSWTQGEEEQESTVIRRLNPKGDNIIEVYDWNPPIGDLRFGPMNAVVKSQYGPSSFIDMVVDEDGIFHVLDSRRGRVFTYDPDCILLDVFGGLGHRKGLLRNPKAIELLDENILVLDSKNNSVTVYRLTEYGRNVQNAIRDYFSGHYDDSQNEWFSVLDENVSFEWANWGIGRVYYRNDEYKKSMDYFRIMRYPTDYSQSFKYYRKEVLEKYFGLLIFLLIVLIIGIKVLQKLLRKKGKHDR